MKKKIQILIKNAFVKIPIYDANQNNLRNRILSKKNKFEKNKFVVSALNDVNLNLFEGDKVGLVGDNGSGKTTLLRLCAGAYRPELGVCKIDGKITSLIDITMGFDDDATGYENIILKGLLLNKKPKDLKTQFSKIEEISELNEFLHLPLRTYSSGMRMRLAYAIAVLDVPEILIMDEWVSAVDKNWLESQNNIFERFVKMSKIVMLASHQHTLLRKYCNRFLRLENGKVEEINKI